MVLLESPLRQVGLCSTHISWVVTDHTFSWQPASLVNQDSSCPSSSASVPSSLGLTSLHQIPTGQHYWTAIRLQEEDVKDSMIYTCLLCFCNVKLKPCCNKGQKLYAVCEMRALTWPYLKVLLSSSRISEFLLSLISASYHKSCKQWAPIKISNVGLL